MAQFYIDPRRENDENALPDAEVFHSTTVDYNACVDEEEQLKYGYYWWTCVPGCMPEGAPIGPFETEEEAIKDARHAGWWGRYHARGEA